MVAYLDKKDKANTNPKSIKYKNEQSLFLYKWSNKTPHKVEKKSKGTSVEAKKEENVTPGINKKISPP